MGLFPQLLVKASQCLCDDELKRVNEGFEIREVPIITYLDNTRAHSLASPRAFLH